MDTKVKGIILSTKDYLEADKIASIFSYEQGIISAKFTGVRKEKAKLKAIAQPFTLAEFELMSKKDFYTVKTGIVIDNFPQIISDYNKTMCAFILLDILKSILPKLKPEPNIFLLSANALKKIEQEDAYQALIEFIIEFIDEMGEGLNIFATDNKVYLDKSIGDFVPTPTMYAVEIDKKVFNALRVPTANESIKKSCLKLLNTILAIKYDAELKSFSFI
ncbi:MAG: DNA repair protein RecO [Clostridia bacterium]|nr:DNA repair protein RecO [Clostridia bacterium]